MVRVEVHFSPVQATNRGASDLSTMPSVTLGEQIHVTLDLPYGFLFSVLYGNARRLGLDSHRLCSGARQGICLDHEDQYQMRLSSTNLMAHAPTTYNQKVVNLEGVVQRKVGGAWCGWAVEELKPPLRVEFGMHKIDCIFAQ